MLCKFSLSSLTEHVRLNCKNYNLFSFWQAVHLKMYTTYPKSNKQGYNDNIITQPHHLRNLRKNKILLQNPFKAQINLSNDYFMINITINNSEYIWICLSGILSVIYTQFSIICQKLYFHLLITECLPVQSL